MNAPSHPPKPVFDADFVGALAEFLEGARMQKAVYDAYLEAGFTEKQALYLIGQLVRSGRDAEA